MTELVRLDMDALTLGDLDDFEEYVGVAIQEALAEKVVIDADTGKPRRDGRGRPVKEVQLSTKALIGIVWVVRRHANPEFTVAQARAVKVAELEVVAPADDVTGKGPGASVLKRARSSATSTP